MNYLDRSVGTILWPTHTKTPYPPHTTHNLKHGGGIEVKAQDITDNDVVIPADDISKFHAYLLQKPREPGFFFADAGSTFGTTLDGALGPDAGAKP